MKRNFWNAALAGLLAASLWLAAGCDDPNDADLPVQPYHLVRAYSLEGSPEDLDVVGSLIAVSNGTFGAVVYENTGGDLLNVKFNYRTRSSMHCTNVALDTVHKYLNIFGSPSGSESSIFDYSLANQDCTHFSFNSPFFGRVGHFGVRANQDTMILYGTDITAANHYWQAKGFERVTDPNFWTALPITCLWFQPATYPRGFAIRPSDGLAFISAEDIGVASFNQSLCRALDTLNTPGQAWDCALSGNLLVVADEYGVIVADVSDPEHVVTLGAVDLGTSSTSMAHRLRHVAIDGSFACVGDELDGVYIVDISTPSAPRFVQLLDMNDLSGLGSDGAGNLYVVSPEQGFLHFRR